MYSPDIQCKDRPCLDDVGKACMLAGSVSSAMSLWCETIPWNPRFRVHIMQHCVDLAWRTIGESQEDNYFSASEGMLDVLLNKLMAMSMQDLSCICDGCAKLGNNH